MNFELGLVSRHEMELVIRYESTDVETHVTRAKYDLAVLLANIGGQLGLFTGFSLLTALEILELVWDVWVLLTTAVCRTLGWCRAV